MNRILMALRLLASDMSVRQEIRARLKRLVLPLPFVLCVFAASSLGASAENIRDCTGIGGVSIEATSGAANIRAERKRVHFVRDGSERPACPNASRECEALSYLVAGDLVIVGRQFETFTCALIIANGGRKIQGWLPTAALEPNTHFFLHWWYGYWIIWGDVPRITIQHVDDVVVSISAELYGVVISGTMKPDGDRLDFAVGPGGKPIPIAEAPENACRLHLRMPGPYLLVEDENSCGTARFTGVYSRS
ncbi:MAG: hypothetical protein ACLPID_01780 [Beijerinckiaceae bacterium]